METGSKKVRVAVIGCGGIAGGYDETSKKEGIFTHAGAYRNHENIEIVAAFDADSARLQEFCQSWSVSTPCNNLDDLISQGYDIVSVCTPDHTHADILKKIIQADCAKYIWTEKPFTTDAASAREILNLANAKKVSLWLNNQRRFEPVHQRLKEAIAEKAIGDVIHVNGYYVKGITHIGCTMVDTLRFLCHEVDWVMAIPPFEVGSYGNDYSISAVLGLANGATASIVGSDPTGYEYSLFELDILGSEGRIRIVDSGNKVEFYHSRPDSCYSGFKALIMEKSEETELQFSLGYLCTQLLQAQQESSFSTALAEEAVRDLEVTEAIKASADNDSEKIFLPSSR